MTSILDKHPAPWKIDEAWGEIRDKSGKLLSSEGRPESPELTRLILASPELLALVKKYADRDARNRAVSASDNPNCRGRVDPSGLELEAVELISRLEPKP
jgi:hypothetical protein